MDNSRKKFWKIFSPPLKVVPSLAGFREGSLKFVYDTAKKQSQVFDLSADRGELNDLMARYPAYAGSGVQLVEWIEVSSRANGESAATDEDMDRLRSLGYLD